MNKKWSIALAVGILLFGFIINVIFSSQSGPKQDQPTKDNSIKYRTETVSVSDFDNSISSTGRVTALNKIEIFAEVGGVLQQSSAKFKAGNYFKQGETLIKIDDNVYKNNLFAQKSTLLNQITLLLPDLSFDFPESTKNWENYLNEFDIESPLKPLPATTNAKEKYYLAAKNIYNLFYTVKSMESTWAKYEIKAPYNGIVTESNINPGTLVMNGQKLGQFISSAEFEVEVAVSPGDAEFLNVSSSVKLISQNDESIFTGKVNRINSAIDINSQMVNVYVRVSDKNIKDGMYVTAIFAGDQIKEASKISRSAINEFDEVFVMSGTHIQRTKVDVVSESGEYVYVRGLQNGTTILSEYAMYTANNSNQQSVSMN